MILKFYSAAVNCQWPTLDKLFPQSPTEVYKTYLMLYLLCLHPFWIHQDFLNFKKWIYSSCMKMKIPCNELIYL